MQYYIVLYNNNAIIMIITITQFMDDIIFIIIIQLHTDLHATDAHSLDVTQQGHSPQYPVAGVAGQCRCRWSLEHYCCDVGEVSATGLLVHRALVQLAVVGVLGGVHCVEVDHW